jgi:hypothetical protein
MHSFPSQFAHNVALGETFVVIKEYNRALQTLIKQWQTVDHFDQSKHDPRF